MPSLRLPRRESLLPPPYSDGPVDLVAIGRRLGRGEPDDLEFAEAPLRFAARATALALIPIAAGALAWITLWDAHAPLEVPAALTVLTFVTLAALVAHVLGHVRPRWRPALERAVWLGAALLRTVCLVVTLALFALFVVFAALKWVDPDFWAEVVEPLEWQLFAWSATAAVIATLLSLRRPLLRIDPRWSWVHAVSTPVPSIVTTCLGLLVLSLITLIPDDVDTVHETTAVFSSLASVAAVIAAVVAAWASIGVGAAQHVRSIRHGIAQSFLEVAGAARAARTPRDGDGDADSTRHDELITALDRLLNDVRHQPGIRLFAPVPADDGVVLVLEGVAARLLGLPLGTSSRRYTRSVDRYLGHPAEHRLIAGLEAFAREFAERARTNEFSTSREFAATLAVIDHDAETVIDHDAETRERASAAPSVTHGSVEAEHDPA